LRTKRRPQERPSRFFAAAAQNDTGGEFFFGVILSAAKDLARQRVSFQHLTISLQLEVGDSLANRRALMASQFCRGNSYACTRRALDQKSRQILLHITTLPIAIARK